MKPLSIIEAPTNAGLKNITGKLPGVDKLPAWFRSHGLHDRLAPSTVIDIAAPLNTMTLDPVSGVLNADAVIAHSKKLAAAVKATTDHFSIVLGGDCSILIGVAAGLKSIGRYGVLYLDGHTDYVLPHQSGTKAAAGMDLAFITGNGPEKLADIDRLKPYVEAQHVFALGNRYYEKEYEDWIRDSGIHYYNLEDLRRNGIAGTVEIFLQMVRSQKLDGFWIHLDVDVLDDALMPCVDSRQPGGLSYEELKQILQPLLQSPLVAGINITILDPDLDPGGKYTAAFVTAFASLFPVTGRSATDV